MSGGDEPAHGRDRLRAARRRLPRPARGLVAGVLAAGACTGLVAGVVALAPPTSRPLAPSAPSGSDGAARPPADAAGSELVRWAQHLVDRGRVPTGPILAAISDGQDTQRVVGALADARARRARVCMTAAGFPSHRDPMYDQGHGTTTFQAWFYAPQLPLVVADARWRERIGYGIGDGIGGHPQVGEWGREDTTTTSAMPPARADEARRALYRCLLDEERHVPALTEWFALNGRVARAARSDSPTPTSRRAVDGWRECMSEAGHDVPGDEAIRIEDPSHVVTASLRRRADEMRAESTPVSRPAVERLQREEISLARDDWQCRLTTTLPEILQRRWRHELAAVAAAPELVAKARAAVATLLADPPEDEER